MAGTVRQLFELQEIDLDIENRERAAKAITARLGESQALRDARSRLAGEQGRLEELLREQRSMETEAEDLTLKIGGAEKSLYDGRIRIPKELSALQQDITLLKARRAQLEDKALVVMEQAEASRQSLSGFSDTLSAAEAEWRAAQAELETELEQTTAALAGLRKKSRELAGSIEPASLAIYQALRTRKGVAVARVEQGICRGCRISLPVSELQLARAGSLVQCSSCGRILYLP